MTCEQLRATDAGSAGQVGPQREASRVMPFREFGRDFGQIEQLAKITQGVRVIEQPTGAGTEYPLVDVAAEMALEDSQAFDADRYSALSGLAPHGNQARPGVNVAPEKADALAKPDRGVEHQREHRLCSADRWRFRFAADDRDCLR